ncbi:MAG: DUF2927 domain-containing protein [Alphaproteobacteria bacterium]|jgi:hypothetical protein|nr:DUF2927 domain-containing protein [Alphaproteobacteria bacterium]MBT5860589.1 DUF2927 domain-containing protein [Alphaproteobacteria bacterium]
MTHTPLYPDPDTEDPDFDPEFADEMSDGDPRLSLRRLVALVVIVAMILALALVVDYEGQREMPATLDRLTDNFAAMVYDDVAEPDVATRLIRWGQPVRVAVTGNVAEASLQEVSALLEEFEALTSVRFLFSPPERANLTIILSRDDFERSALLISRPDNVQCVTTTAGGGRGIIAGARILIPDDLDEATTSKCLAHELMHALGFQGHPSMLFPSALSNDPSYKNLSINDRILIRALYDNRLEWHMSRAEIVTIARAIIAGLLDQVENTDDVLAALAR